MTTPSNWLLRWNAADNRRPEILDPDGEQGPLTSTVPHNGGFALFDGYLFDRKELCSELRIQPDTPEPSILLHASQKWRDGLFDKLRGGFVAGIWDEAKRSLIIGRDALGLRSCFYWWDGHLLILSSSVEAILSQPEVPRRFNREAVAEFLIGSFTSHQIHETLYAGVRRLPPAHTLSLGRDALTVSRYWDPLPPGFTWADKHEMEQFHPLLERAVARCLAVRADSIALSGGFDSVSLAVVAAGQLEGMPPLQAFSVLKTCQARRDSLMRPSK